MQDTKALRRDVRSATRMMIMVVSCYLLSNVLSVVITAWEHIDSDSLYEHAFAFFTLGSDVASLLTVVASALRLPIYAVNNPQIRRELRIILNRALHPMAAKTAKSKCDTIVSKTCNNNTEPANEPPSDENPGAGCRQTGSWLSAVGDCVTEQPFCQTQQRRSSASFSSSEPSAFTTNCTSYTAVLSSPSDRDPNSICSRGIVTVYVMREDGDNSDAANSSTVDYVTRKQGHSQLGEHLVS